MEEQNSSMVLAQVENIRGCVDKMAEILQRLVVSLQINCLLCNGGKGDVSQMTNVLFCIFIDVMDICLKGTTMAERAQSLLETGLGSDCEFLVGSKENKVMFKTSKTLLTRASPVFERMFYGGLQTSNPIQVPDIEPQVFQLMLQYMYGCQWSFENSEQVVSMCYGAHKYMLKELLDRCVEYLWPTTVDDMWSALHCASLYELQHLKEACLKVVRIYAHSVLASSQFISISKCSLIDIVQQDYMNITSETELFEAVVQWATAQCKDKGLCMNPDNLQEEVKEVINHIRFLSLSAAEFAEGPGESQLLSTEHKLAILKTIVTHGNIAAPDYVCPIWEPRKEYTCYI